MAEVDGKKLARTLGFLDEETLDGVIETHPTIQAYINGAISFVEAMFIEEYLSNGFNTTEAMRICQTKALERKTYDRIARNVMNKPTVRRLLSRRLAERALDADAVLAMLADVANASMDDFVEIKEVVDPATGEGMWTAVPNLKRAKESGKLHLAKELQYDSNGNLKIKLRDQDKALDMLSKHLGLFELDNLQKVPQEIIELLKLSGEEKKAKLGEYSKLLNWEEDGKAGHEHGSDEPVSGG